MTRPFVQPVITWRGGLYHAQLPGVRSGGFGPSPEAAVAALRALSTSPNLKWHELPKAQQERDS